MIKKPGFKKFGQVFDFYEICRYIGKKYQLPGGDNWKHHFYEEESFDLKMCFWHYLLRENWGSDISHGCIKTLSLNPEDYTYKFMKEIIGFFKNEFGEYADEEGWIEVWIDW